MVQNAHFFEDFVSSTFQESSHESKTGSIHVEGDGKQIPLSNPEIV